MPALPSKGRQVLRGERWPSGAGGLLTDDLQDGGRAEVGLVEQEVVGADRLQPERFECGGGEVLRVCGDDALRATPDRRREQVPVVLVGQPDSRLEFSQPVTSASSKASRICADLLPASTPGWISSVAACASARIRSDHSGRYKRFSATRRRQGQPMFTYADGRPIRASTSPTGSGSSSGNWTCPDPAA